MARPRLSPHGKRTKLSISVDPQIAEKVLALIGPGKRFASMSQAVETGLFLVVEEEGTTGRASRGSSHKK